MFSVPLEILKCVRLFGYRSYRNLFLLCSSLKIHDSKIHSPSPQSVTAIIYGPCVLLADYAQILRVLTLFLHKQW